MRKVLYLLGELTDNDVEWIIRHGARQRLAPGTVLIKEGQPVGALYLLLDGALEVTGVALGGGRAVRLGCGEVVGEISFVDSRPPTATVTAADRAVVLAIPRAALTAKLGRDHEFAARFYRALAVFLANRIRATGQRVAYAKDQPLNEDVEYQDELGEDVLDNLHMAGSRFDRILQRLLAE